jgi:hypothetical protein
MNKGIRRFEDNSVFILFYSSDALIAREDFIESCRRESFRSYTVFSSFIYSIVLQFIFLAMNAFLWPSDEACYNV